jgi:hypothetical protein
MEVLGAATASCCSCGQGWLEFAQPKSDKGNAIMSTAELFTSLGCETLQAAKKADEPREQFVLLKLALEWAAAAKREEAAPPPTTQSLLQHRIE